MEIALNFHSLDRTQRRLAENPEAPAIYVKLPNGSDASMSVSQAEALEDGLRGLLDQIYNGGDGDAA